MGPTQNPIATRFTMAGSAAHLRNQFEKRRHKFRTGAATPPCSSHGPGSVPARKVSETTTGQKKLAARPLVASILTIVTPAGTANDGGGYASRAARMKSAQMGSAPCAPVSPWASPLSNPTQTSVTSVGVYPTNHASRPSFVVPLRLITVPAQAARLENRFRTIQRHCSLC